MVARKIKGATRRVKKGSRMRRTLRMRGGQSVYSTTSTSVPTISSPVTSKLGVIKVPMATMPIKGAIGGTNFNFSKAVSSLPASFGTFVPGTTGDSSTFVINLAPTYNVNNLPQFMVTGYVYSQLAGYIHVQRQFGVKTGVAAAGIEVDKEVKKITFKNITKATGNFPATGNDAQGYALYIMFTILN